MILTIASTKGGVGKTATAVNIAACLATRGRTLAVDADPQDSLGRALGVVSTSPTESLAALMADPSVPASDVIVSDVQPGLDVLPAHPKLEGVADELVAQGAIAASLRRVLRQVRQDYDYIVIDTHGDSGPMTQAALCAADAVVTVYTSDPGSALGAVRLASYLAVQRRYDNSAAVLLGAACSNWDRDSAAARQVAAALTGTDLPLLQTRIPTSRRVASAALAKRPVVLSAPTSGVSAAYRALTEEILDTYTHKDVR